MSIFLDKYYLLHTFKEVTGFTIKQYILLKRIAFAKNQLYYTDKNITAISIDSGFNSQSNFIRLFKKKEGITPLQFRIIIKKHK
ncbi:helix-turn-helix protein [Natranaerovirga pectinivora]|uniref:Helix-turn-helix protein n=1 Tax=Natranaerovirga pectinivora TaxID=682400 RepID=A0A4R3MNB0_9FIRM|nr:AraC family transcriptional regulator [Natranaerovirga pectinivora]TCT15524.1 helix-turn-helix protein [Natranaerovirga pectinivora]